MSVALAPQPGSEEHYRQRYDRAWELAMQGDRRDWSEFTDEDQAKLLRTYHETRWEYCLEAMRVPSRLHYATFYEGQETAALKRAQVFVADEYGEGCCLVLTGPTGIGKTYAAVAALRALQEIKRVPVRRFWYFPALCGALLDPTRRKDALEDVTKTKMLVLDDLGVEYVKEGGLLDTFLDEIIWTRESEYLPTIITTNLTTEALKQRLPGRLIDRLRGEWGRVFECPGESLRGGDQQ